MLRLLHSTAPVTCMAQQEACMCSEGPQVGVGIQHQISLSLCNGQLLLEARP